MDTLQETFSEHSPAADDGNGRRPTMKQVAALAGVSLATVSRVVNGGPSVRPDLAARVHEAVELLGYRHNLTASSLRRADRLSASIGLIFEDVANPFFSAVHRGVEEVARERGVLTFAGSSDERPDRERELAESFSARRVDGLIIAPPRTDHSYLQRDRDSRRGARLRRPPGELRRRRRRAHRQRRRRPRRRHAPRRARPPPHRLPRRPPRPATRPPSACAATATRSPATASREEPTLIRARAHERRRTTPRASCCSPRTRRPRSSRARTSSPSTRVRAIHDLDLQRDGRARRLRRRRAGRRRRARAHRVAQDPTALGRRAAELLFSRLDGYTGPSRRVVHPDDADRARLGRAGAGSGS